MKNDQLACSSELEKSAKSMFGSKSKKTATESRSQLTCWEPQGSGTVGGCNDLNVCVPPLIHILRPWFLSW